MQFSPQKSFHSVNDAQLLKLTLLAAKTEKEAILALLDYLVEVDSRRLYATVNACSSLFDYLVKELGFSHPAASERVNAVRLIRAVPLVKEHLETGKLTVTSAAQIQRFVNAEQKVDPKGRAVSPAEKEKVVEACLGKSIREGEKTLFEKQSEPARTLIQEKVRLVTATRSEIKFTVDEATLAKLKHLRDLVGDQALEKIFDQGLDALLVLEEKKRGVVPKRTVVSERKPKPHRKSMPLQKSTSEISPERHAECSRPADSAAQEETKNTTAAYLGYKPQPETHAQLNSRFIPIDLKRFVVARSKGRCEFLDPRTKTRCDSTFRLQVDHRTPLALGGKTHASNLRHLCSAHHLKLATQAGLSRPNSIPKYR